MKTKLLFTLTFLTQIILAQQVTLMQPALRDSDKNIVRREYYNIDVDTNVESKINEYLYTDYDAEKNPITLNLESFDENENVISTRSETSEYYPIDEYHVEGMYSTVSQIFPYKLIDSKLLNPNTNELLDSYRVLFSKDGRFSLIDYGSDYLEFSLYQYDTNYNLTGGQKEEVIMQGENPIEKLFYIFNDTTNEFDPDFKQIFYETFVNYILTERITTKITDFTTNLEENYKKETFTFLTNAFERQFFYWNDTLNDWKLETKFVTTYNGNNQPLSYLEHSWNEATSIWSSGVGYYYTYNALDLLETYTVDFGGNWNDVFTFTYDTDNLLTEINQESYENSILISKTRQLFYYELETVSTNSINTSKISIFPNLTNNVLNIDLEEDFNYQIYSIQGKLLKEGKANKQIQVNDLEKGIYFINIKTNDLEEKHKFIID